MQTERDGKIVEWIGGLGAAGVEHVMARFGMSSRPVYARLQLLVRDGLLSRQRILYDRPGLYTATLAGLRWRGLDGLGVYRVAPGGFEHAWQVADVAVALARGLPEWRVLGEREFGWRERQEQTLLASVQVGSRGAQRAALHRPDLVLLSPQGRVVAVEVELSVKARLRLLAICRGWARARHVDVVYYLAARPAASAVGRAVRETRAEDRIEILGLGEAEELVRRERGA